MKPKMPDTEALKSIISAMKKMDLDRIKGYRSSDEEDMPVIEIEKEENEEED